MQKSEFDWYDNQTGNRIIVRRDSPLPKLINVDDWKRVNQNGATTLTDDERCDLDRDGYVYLPSEEVSRRWG